MKNMNIAVVLAIVSVVALLLMQPESSAAQQPPLTGFVDLHTPNGQETGMR